jgi:hypothetical protein
MAALATRRRNRCCFPMPDASSLLTSALPADDAAAAAGVDWNQVLFDAFDESVPEAGFLPLAEEAVRAQPADPTTLLAAATAALFDGKTARAQVFLKRFFKRYQPTLPYQLLRALVAASENKPAAARAILEAHGMEHAMLGMRQFFGGWARQDWLVEHYDRIFERRKRAAAPRRTSPVATKDKARAKAKVASAPPRADKAPASAAEAPPLPPGLPRIDIDIPLTTAFDVGSLIDLMRKTPDGAGDWYRLRERFAHLGLAQGFDELFCLPHLRGIETFWYQVETVRKVLKQFRGRVLLADEVGLGKTVEAGMVMKEYLLRGMAENVLVLVPASLVGQWREELETKFDIACATTHDPFAAQRSRPVLEPEAHRRLAGPGASWRACRTTGRAQFRSRHRRRGASSARSRKPELQAGRCAQQALPAAAVGDTGPERPRRTL